MKEKTLNALHILLDVTTEDLGFLIVCGIVLVIIFKLACV